MADKEASPGQLNLDEPPSWGSRSLDCFETLGQIGEGTYGQVYKAKEKSTGDIVALKRVRMDNEKEGFPITAIREIKLLKKLKHDNIINLKEIVTSKAQENNKFKGSIYMVFEYMDHDLTGLSDRPGVRFSVPQIKCYMKQLLNGLHYCHINQVLHRDIKGSNLLIDNNGILKLADFGLARSYSQESTVPLTNRVITLWYRPPELLLGASRYGPPVDMWSVGCIFAELLQGKPILPGKNEFEQLNLIFQLCGTPDENIWPGFSKLPWYNPPERHLKRRVREAFKHFDPHALELVEKMLTLDPTQRISAKDALDADYFWTDPLPCEPSSLPTYEASHEYETKRAKQQQRQKNLSHAKQGPRESGPSQAYAPHTGPAGSLQASRQANAGSGGGSYGQYNDRPPAGGGRGRPAYNNRPGNTYGGNRGSGGGYGGGSRSHNPNGPSNRHNSSFGGGNQNQSNQNQGYSNRGFNSTSYVDIDSQSNPNFNYSKSPDRNDRNDHRNDYR